MEGPVKRKAIEKNTPMTHRYRKDQVFKGVVRKLQNNLKELVPYVTDGKHKRTHVIDSLKLIKIIKLGHQDELEGLELANAFG